MATQLAETVEVVTPPVTDAANDETPTQERDFEAEARAQGWTDKEAFKGDPNKWVDAETFARRADEVMPFLKKQNGNLKRELDDMKTAIKRLTKAEMSAYQNGMDEARRQMREAVATGDTKAYQDAETRLDNLQKEAATPSSKASQDPRPAFAAFREANEWYDLGNQPGATEVERRARAKADIIADRMVTQGLHESLSPEEFFDKVAEETRAAIPQVDAKPAQRAKPASDVAGVTRGGVARNARTGANLPPEAKEAAERYMRMGIFKVKTKAEAYDKMAQDWQWEGR